MFECRKQQQTETGSRFLWGLVLNFIQHNNETFKSKTESSA